MQTTLTSFILSLTILLTDSAQEAPKPGDANFPTPSPSARHSKKVAAVKSGDYDLVLIGDFVADAGILALRSQL